MRGLPKNGCEGKIRANPQIFSSSHRLNSNAIAKIVKRRGGKVDVRHLSGDAKQIF